MLMNDQVLFTRPPCSDDHLQLPVPLCSWIGCVLILLDVEPSQQHDSFLPEHTSIAGIGWVRTGVIVDRQDTAGATKSIVPTTIVDRPNAILSQRRSTHDTRLHSDIEIRLLQLAGRELLQELADSEELCMSGPIERAVGVVHASSNNLAIVD